MQESLRKSTITLPLFGALAVAAGVATFTVKRSSILTGAQLGLTDTGTGAGNTSTVIKVNGNAVTASLNIAGAAGSKSAAYSVTPSSPETYPAGVALKPGDVVTVDVTAIPATTQPKGGAVYLDVVQRDV